VRILDLLFVSALLLAQIALTVTVNMLKLWRASKQRPAGMRGGVANLNTLPGLACFGFAFLLYSPLLQYLNLAQTIRTLQYVCVIVAAAVFL